MQIARSDCFLPLIRIPKTVVTSLVQALSQERHQRRAFARKIAPSVLALGHEWRSRDIKGTKSAPRKRSNPGCVGNDRGRKRYVERFRATEWVAPSEFRNWLELRAILRIRWAELVTVRNGPEGIARGTAETFDSYLSLPFPNEKTVVFPHRVATLAG